MTEENKRLQQEVEKQQTILIEVNSQLEVAYLETVERLSKAAEYRDNTNGRHIKRVGKIAAIIAGAIGMETEVIKTIEVAAPLHDIGKIGIPEKILYKPGKLNKDEWAIMKKHVGIGKDILKNSKSNVIAMAETIAYTHHEKWDGTGYPLALKGEQIPIVGQIVAIADVFDVLLSNRPYKIASRTDEAIKIIIGEEGNYFSPKMVNAFLVSLEKIKAVEKNYSNGIL